MQKLPHRLQERCIRRRVGTALAMLQLGGMTIRSFHELVAWQRAMALARMVYAITAKFPRSEMFGLAGQMRRAAVSIPSNVAEGSRHATRGYRARLRIALGEHAELETQCDLARQLGWVGESDWQRFEALSAEVGRLVHGLRRSLASVRQRGSEPD
jgi:four helix bundle protein